MARRRSGWNSTLADAATSAGAPVFLHDRAIALVAAREGMPEGNLVPIDGLDAVLESEALAAPR